LEFAWSLVVYRKIFAKTLASSVGGPLFDHGLIELFNTFAPLSRGGHVVLPATRKVKLKETADSMADLLAPGTKAPDFTLHATPDQTVSLSELTGRPVILAFYPADWSPVCGDQMALYNEILPEFHKHRAELLGISVDGVWCHAAFAHDRRLHFPLLADFEPKGAVASMYGVPGGRILRTGSVCHRQRGCDSLELLLPCRSEPRR
jgi:peroxiredoxin